MTGSCVAVPYLRAQDRIFVAGHRGLVGSAVTAELTKRGYRNLIMRTRSELDLTDTAAVAKFYAKERPDAVIVCAARVGGIKANNEARADFIYENLQIQNSVIWGAHASNVRRLIFLGSSCIYPRHAPQPMQEDSLLSGPLEYTNRPYALAKIAGLELVHALRIQYGRDYWSVMPTNLYGPGDNFDRESSHVIPALIRRFVEAAQDNSAEVAVWGSGTPLREFLHARDCARAIVFLAEHFGELEWAASRLGNSSWSHVNIGSGEEVSTGELARLIARHAGYRGSIRFDASMPDGTPRKLLDSTVLRDLGFTWTTSLDSGLKETLDWFRVTEGKRMSA